MKHHWLAWVACAATALAGGASAVWQGEEQPRYQVESLRGRVVWASEAMRRLHGVESDADAAEWLIVLETPSGELHPLVKDARGRAFYKDERLRQMDLELLVRRYPGTPLLKVIRVYRLRDGAKYELDYWCDVCAITMYELKECECCQGPIRLRETLVKP
ncbi:MAG: hypothetical protein K6T86_13215 [Pirellulales bacterium]|nr:hypothetical protein [Pirellulales bacterium]